MRDKVRVNDLRVLFVCPSDAWGTLERRVINDCHYLRDIGGNPMLYCIKGSQVDKEAQKYSLPRQFYKGKKVNKFFDITFYLDLKKTINEFNFDLIHCYNMDYIWTICFLLMAKPQFPLCLTFNKFLQKDFDGLMEKWLLKRIDLVLTFSKTLKEQLLAHTSIVDKKVYTLGAGVEPVECDDLTLVEVKKIGTFISHKSQFDLVESYLHALNSIAQSLEAKNKKVHFFIFTQRDADFGEEIELIQEKAKELGIETLVDFVEIDLISAALKKLNLYVSLSFNEPFDDVELINLLSGTPIVAPRTAARSELLNGFKRIGLSYQQSDSRELRESVLEILAHEDSYRKSIQDNMDGLLAMHGLESYVELVYQNYIRLYSQRARLASLKLKSN